MHVTVASFLIGVGWGCAWVIVVLVKPHHRCPRCRGERRVRNRWDGRIMQCPKCKGRGETRRFGARLIHAWFWALMGDRTREQIRKQVEDKK